MSNNRIDTENTKFHERSSLKIGPGNGDDFTRAEAIKARRLLRRLRFLETQIKGSADNTSNAAMHTAEEADALEWALGPEGLDFMQAVEGGA